MADQEVPLATIKSVAVYCGSRMGHQKGYQALARDIGRHIGEQGLRLVYGGASVGLMGSVADGALHSGAEVIGVLPEVLKDKEFAHQGLTQLLEVRDMHERKSMMAALSDAFIALPGGIGTLEELFEMLTWHYLKLHQKPCILLNFDGYYDALLAFLKHSQDEGFSAPMPQLWVSDQLDEVFAALSAGDAPAAMKPLA